LIHLETVTEVTPQYLAMSLAVKSSLAINFGFIIQLLEILGKVAFVALVLFAINVVLSPVYTLQGQKSMKIAGRLHELCVKAAPEPRLGTKNALLMGRAEKWLPVLPFVEVHYHFGTAKT
jgi:hypothetical protein